MGSIKLGFNLIVNTLTGRTAELARAQASLTGAAANYVGQNRVVRDELKRRAQSMVARGRGNANPLLDGLARVEQVSAEKPVEKFQRKADQDERVTTLRRRYTPIEEQSTV